MTKYGEAFYYLGITLDIPIFFFVGFILGREYGQPVLGAFIGTMVGIAMTLFYVIRRALKEQKSSSQ
ncbi:MAG: hypothetical protein GTN80_00985 [Nitrososphaeria archaeon]|nr:hypothetical protein [Nitrososphaeria archaeon]NIN51726.1 hypothetical protein [Nitrososphaeria archaeon]NIQ32220.1 hypothetical protein [Nitrososphaeria archaeon]